MVEYRGTLAELRETAKELGAAKSIWMNRAGRVVREHCEMYPRESNFSENQARWDRALTVVRVA